MVVFWPPHMFRVSVILALFLIAGNHWQAFAQADDFDWYSNIGVVSDDRLRGVSLSENQPALQLESTLEHASGFYANVWVSAPLGDSPNEEIDLTAGRSFESEP